MATVVAIVWGMKSRNEVREGLQGTKLLHLSDCSAIYTFQTTTNIFRHFPYWSSGNNWVVCDSLEQAVEVWKEHGLIKAFEGHIPMPAFYEIEEWIIAADAASSKAEASLDNEPEAS